MHTKALSALLGCLLVFSGCEKEQLTANSPSGPEAKTAPKMEACALVTREEIQEVQGSPITDSKSSEHTEGSLRSSQCYFLAQESNRSVSLTLTQGDPADADSRKKVTDYWTQMFAGSEAEEKEKEPETAAEKEKKESLRAQTRGGDEEEKRTPPKKIEGLGESAYWIGNRVGGTLYVLKNGAFIRFSVGGPDKEEIKIEKSKKLAEKALARL